MCNEQSRGAMVRRSLGRTQQGPAQVSDGAQNVDHMEHMEQEFLCYGHVIEIQPITDGWIVRLNPPSKLFAGPREPAVRMVSRVKSPGNLH